MHAVNLTSVEVHEDKQNYPKRADIVPIHAANLDPDTVACGELAASCEPDYHQQPNDCSENV